MLVRKYVLTCPYCREIIDLSLPDNIVHNILYAYMATDNWYWVPCDHCGRDFQIDINYLQENGKLVDNS